MEEISKTSQSRLTRMSAHLLKTRSLQAETMLK